MRTFYLGDEDAAPVSEASGVLSRRAAVVTQERLTETVSAKAGLLCGPVHLLGEGRGLGGAAIWEGSGSPEGPGGWPQSRVQGEP